MSGDGSAGTSRYSEHEQESLNSNGKVNKEVQETDIEETCENPDDPDDVEYIDNVMRQPSSDEDPVHEFGLAPPISQTRKDLNSLEIHIQNAIALQFKKKLKKCSG